jgi:hypothetical protein
MLFTSEEKKTFFPNSMNDLDLFSNSPSLNLTDHQHEPPIFSSTPLVIVEKPPSSSTSSSFFLPLTENTYNNDQLIKLNEVCLPKLNFLHKNSILGSLPTRFI